MNASRDIEEYRRLGVAEESLDPQGKGGMLPDVIPVARQMLWMSSVDRDILQSPFVPNGEAVLIVDRAVRNTTIKLGHLDLTLDDYFDAHMAFSCGDRDILRQISASAKKRFRNKVLLPDTKQMHTDQSKDTYTSERQKLHRVIVADAMKKVVGRQRPTFDVVVAGYGTGKTEVLRNTYVDEGTLLSDPDAHRSRLLPEFDASIHDHVRRTSREVADVSDLLLQAGIVKRASILCETSLGNYDWWKNTITRMRRLGYTVQLHIAHRPVAEMFQRVIAFRDRGARVENFLDFIGRFKHIIEFARHPAISKVTFTDMTGIGLEESTGSCPFTDRHVRSMKIAVR